MYRDVYRAPFPYILLGDQLGAVKAVSTWQSLQHRLDFVNFTLSTTPHSELSLTNLVSLLEHGATLILSCPALVRRQAAKSLLKPHLSNSQPRNSATPRRSALSLPLRHRQRHRLRPASLPIMVHHPTRRTSSHPPQSRSPPPRAKR